MSMFTVVGGIGAAKLRSACTSLEGSHGLNAVMWPPMGHRSHKSAHSSTLSSDGRMKPTVAIVMVSCRLVAIVPGCERGWCCCCAGRQYGMASAGMIQRVSPAPV
jgi:hypothetical protein